MRTIRNYGLALALWTAPVFAQSAIPPNAWTGTVDPNRIIWIIVAIMGGIGTGVAVLALIWTAIQGLMSDHSHFDKLPKIAIWAGILAGAMTLGIRMTTTGA